MDPCCAVVALASSMELADSPGTVCLVNEEMQLALRIRTG